MKTIKLKNNELEKVLNENFKNYKSETIFYNQSLSSDYKKLIYGEDNNIIAKFYSDNLFDNCELITY